MPCHEQIRGRSITDLRLTCRYNGTAYIGTCEISIGRLYCPDSRAQRSFGAQASH
jgi:hypothetical protein